MRLSGSVYALIDFVDKTYLNTPYKGLSEGYAHPVLSADPDGPKVYRPYHGLLHTLRTIMYLDDVIDLFKERALSPAFRQYCATLTDKQHDELIMILAFLVTGRSSESGREAGFAYKRSSADNFADYARAQHMDEDRIRVCKTVILNMGDKDYAKNNGFAENELVYLHYIVSLAHMLDLPRIKDRAGVEKRIKPFEELLTCCPTSYHHLMLLVEKAEDMLVVCGESQQPGGDKSLEKFCSLSLDSKLALDTLSKSSESQSEHIRSNQMDLSSINFLDNEVTHLRVSYYPPKRLYLYDENETVARRVYQIDMRTAGEVIIDGKNLMVSTTRGELSSFQLNKSVAQFLHSQLVAKHGEFSRCRVLLQNRKTANAYVDNQITVYPCQNGYAYHGVSSEGTIVSGDVPSIMHESFNKAFEGFSSTKTIETLEVKEDDKLIEKLKVSLAGEKTYFKSIGIAELLALLDEYPEEKKYLLSLIVSNDMLKYLVVTPEIMFEFLKASDDKHTIIERLGNDIPKIAKKRSFLILLKDLEPKYRLQILQYIPDGHFFDLLPRSPAMFNVAKYLEEFSEEETALLLKKFGKERLQEKYPSIGISVPRASANTIKLLFK